MSAHSALVNRILLRFSLRPDLTLWKLNTGVGKPLHSDRVVRFGIKGGTDIIGIIKPSGRWIAIECKTGSGKLEQDQETFRDVVIAHGALYVEARCLEDVQVALDQLQLKGLDQPCAAL